MLYIFGGFDDQIDLNLVFSLISSVVLYCPPCLGCVGRECQAWMCKCLLQRETPSICSTLGFLIYFGSQIVLQDASQPSFPYSNLVFCNYAIGGNLIGGSMYSEVFPSFLTKLRPISSPFDINRAPPALPVPPPRLVWIPSARPPEF